MMRYAAYGSNLHPVRLRERVPSARLLGTGVVRDFSLRFHKRGADGSAKCNITSSSGEIHVAVYEIATAHKEELDRIEGVGSGYEVERITVPKVGHCFTYVASESHIDDHLRPFTWYRELVLVGCRHLGFPADYVREIGTIRALRDSDAERHARHMSIVRRAESA